MNQMVDINRSKIEREETAQARWSRFKPITTGDEYLESLRGRQITCYLFGESVANPVDHPIVRPSMNALKATYELATEDPELATAWSPLIDAQVNRFLHIVTSPNDLVMKNKMQRRMGQITGTCFQRCAGLDTISVLHSITYDIDAKHGTAYHTRYLEWLKNAQRNNIIVGAGMTDPKGDRSKRPHEQADPDMFMHVTRRTKEGLYVRGAKAHMTGGLNSHWICVMPTMNLGEKDKEFAVIGVVPADAAGMTFIYGRQSCDTRALEKGSIDQGNAKFGGQETLVVFDDVFIPWEHVFMDGEYEFAQELVTRFTAYHRASYVCKTGLGDVMVGAAAAIAEYNGADGASHIKDKLVEMTHLNETIFSSGIASSHESKKLASGIFMNDAMLANVCKHNVTRFPYEISRLAQDLAGGLMVTLPSQSDFEHDVAGPMLAKYFKGKEEIPLESRVRMLRLIENMTLGRNAVGYLTESMHGAGSPQAQRIQILRGMDVERKKNYAKKLADIPIAVVPK
ncbi:vinylacetyl-CoA delta-isomerase /4-hydroxybutyryl-CoA dehydratase [Panacagrimonas perspica]|uniref:Vinylacetyl-CoA delta-isomerase /4-hydroxybutyryl-CoA dehydratase n=1 Tax=Panacagrimonas perspica TaxID=381431 RepID=A0A4S3K8M8_9GAMM|nr:4-hydroxyphenylacetate 3-hydroxylase N-terminal domain-containing protein [Panacagrimonas perspica]TDU24198.1 vinylacetyl-CoA delta-isomerase /4-hydroxybutyryl-CoA dehydratase [Panacagrimonas perspica]THD04610.1 4-hydroxybutyryl-CoA dehydratase [Panacagrimonas perspica]